jgi:hypothetical protein
VKRPFSRVLAIAGGDAELWKHSEESDISEMSPSIKTLRIREMPLVKQLLGKSMAKKWPLCHSSATARHATFLFVAEIDFRLTTGQLMRRNSRYHQIGAVLGRRKSDF